MGSNKFMKAKCRKTGRWYGLEIKQFGSTWKVVNMIDLSESDAAVITSEIKQASFETADNLLACAKCGKRKVGGCACAKRRPCEKNMKYRFDCIYCNEFEIDYSLPSLSDVSGRVGDTIVLSQGQEVKIQYSDNRSLSKIFVGVGWDPAYRGGPNIDVDSSVVVLAENSEDLDLVYFGDKEHRSGCVIHHGDNLTGEDEGNEDDENISVFLNKVPADRDRLVFVLNIYECESRQQTFGSIKNLYIKLYDPDSGKVLVEYRVTGNYDRDTAMIIGMAYKKNGDWMFKAIGQGSKATSVSRLAEECKYKCR